MLCFVVNILIFGKVYVHVDTYSFSNRLARRYETLVSRDEILVSRDETLLSREGGTLIQMDGFSRLLPNPRDGGGELRRRRLKFQNRAF